MLKLVILTCLFSQILGNESKICERGKFWYDEKSDGCLPCTVCSTDFLELIPCTRSSNTWCVDLSTLKKDLNFHRESDPKSYETKARLLLEEKQTMTIRKTVLNNDWHFLVSIAVLTGLVLILVVVIVRQYGMFQTCRSKKSRLHDHEFLDTTDYTKNLTLLDRRLAMDDILAKRKAVFEPRLLNQDVFVDLSGTERSSYRNENDYAECENRRHFSA